MTERRRDNEPEIPNFFTFFSQTAKYKEEIPGLKPNFHTFKTVKPELLVPNPKILNDKLFQKKSETELDIVTNYKTLKMQAIAHEPTDLPEINSQIDLFLTLTESRFPQEFITPKVKSTKKI